MDAEEATAKENLVRVEDSEKEEVLVKDEAKEKESTMQDKWKTKHMVKAKVVSKVEVQAKDLYATTVERLDTLQPSVGPKAKEEKAKFGKSGERNGGKMAIRTSKPSKHQAQLEILVEVLRTPRQVREEMKEFRESSLK